MQKPQSKMDNWSTSPLTQIEETKSSVDNWSASDLWRLMGCRGADAYTHNMLKPLAFYWTIGDIFCCELLLCFLFSELTPLGTFLINVRQ